MPGTRPAPWGVPDGRSPRKSRPVGRQSILPARNLLLGLGLRLGFGGRLVFAVLLGGFLDGFRLLAVHVRLGRRLSLIFLRAGDGVRRGLRLRFRLIGLSENASRYGDDYGNSEHTEQGLVH